MFTAMIRKDTSTLVPKQFNKFIEAEQYAHAHGECECESILDENGAVVWQPATIKAEVFTDAPAKRKRPAVKKAAAKKRPVVKKAAKRRR
jgi:hypothetical protein